MTESNFISYRSFEVTATEGKRVGVVATETPVPMPDGKRGLIPEVLLMSGLRLDSTTLPLLDSHDRSSVDSIKGSMTNLRVENGQLIGDIEISSTEPDIQKKLDEGHIRALSVGYQILDRIQVRQGETREYEGRQYAGPTNLVTAWRPFEDSLIPVGADTNAKIRSQWIDICEHDADNQTRGTMSDEVKTKEEVPAVENKERAITDVVADKVDKEAIRKQAVEDERNRCSSIHAVCRSVGHANLADQYINENKSVAEAERALLAHIAEGQKKTAVPAISFGASHEEKRNGAFVDALICRHVGSTEFERLFPEAKRAVGYQSFVGCTIPEMARQMAEAAGVNTRGMSNLAVIEEAMRGAPAYNTTGSLTNLLKDVTNKVLLPAFSEAQYSYQTVFKQGSSIPDYKDAKPIRVSAIGNLEVVPENGKPSEIALSDRLSTLTPHDYKKIISISARALANDDLGGLVGLSQSFARAAKRTLNATCWAVVFANEAMPDGYNLWDDTNHGNNVASGNAAPTTAQLNLMRQRLRKMKDINGTTFINPTPKFLAGPPELETTIRQLCTSEYDITATSSINTQVPNTYFGLLPVIDPILSGNSVTAYYMIADPADAVLVQYCFVSGQESPIVQTHVDFETDAFKIKLAQAWAVGAVDYQGGVKNNG